ncbi:LamG-like jellyroll fold domain-containing protein [Polaribacter sp.]|uniref:LamG-like jellyroll fold domain-containing protein n=1 Tax=Polaribacter sp. TaxID=1920175 RepID=UPI003EF1CACD
MKKNYIILLIYLASFHCLHSQNYNALNFDGTNDYVSTSLPSVFSDIPNNDITIEAWVFPETFQFSRILFAQLDANNFVSISFGNNGEILGYVSNVSGEITTDSLELNKWSHVAITWNHSTEEIQIYINGVLAPLGAGTSTSTTGNDNAMTIGAKTNETQYFDGSIDDLRIWNAIRTAPEINANMNISISGSKTNLINNYKFNQGQGGLDNTGITTLNDNLNTNNGSLINFALTGTSSNWITVDESITNSNYLNFDGTNDYVSTALPAIFSDIPNNDITIEAWVFPETFQFSRILFAQLDANNFVSISFGNNGEILGYVSNVSGEITTDSLELNKWAHVAITWNHSTEEIQIYINGVLAPLSAGASTSTTGNNNAMTIGTKTNETQFFDGSIDDLRIWNTIRTAPEISANMNKELFLPQTNLIHNYKFDHGQGGLDNTGVTTLQDELDTNNGSLNNFTLNGNASNYLTRSATKVNVVLEQFTGTWCGFCPDGAEVVSTILDQYPDNLIPISIHSSDVMEYADGITTEFSGGSYPGGMINRKVFTGEPNEDQSRTSWSSNVTSEMARYTPVEIEVSNSYNSATRTITATITGNFVDYVSGDLRFVMQITEDNVTGGQEYNQANYYNDTAGHPYQGAGDPIVGYSHRFVLRANEPGPYGNAGVIPANVVPGSSYSETFTYTIPESFDESNISVIGFVANSDPIVGQRDILNAAIEPLTAALSIKQESVFKAFTVYPNPAENNFTLRFNLEEPAQADIVMYNIFGKEVKKIASKDFNFGEQKIQVSVRDLSKGIYFVTIRENNKSFTKKLIIR